MEIVITDETTDEITDRIGKLFGEPLPLSNSLQYRQRVTGTFLKQERIGRNEPCPCKSGYKYKRCCLRRETNG